MPLTRNKALDLSELTSYRNKGLVRSPSPCLSPASVNGDSGNKASGSVPDLWEMPRKALCFASAWTLSWKGQLNIQSTSHKGHVLPTHVTWVTSLPHLVRGE